MELREYWRVFKRRAWIPILLLVVTVATAGTLAFLSKPEYRATATVSAKSVGTTTSGQTLSFPEVATSNTLMVQVIQKLGRNETVDHLTARIKVATGLPFLDHMLEQLAKHGGFSLMLSCQGDLQIDEHHTVEDCALALGQALRQALGEKCGVARYGFVLPMDESEAQSTLALSARAFAPFSGRFPREAVGGLPTELVPHFFRSLGEALGAAIHVDVRGENSHHMVEACFKSVGRSLRQAFRREGQELPTTKGVL